MRVYVMRKGERQREYLPPTGVILGRTYADRILVAGRHDLVLGLVDHIYATYIHIDQGPNSQSRHRILRRSLKVNLQICPPLSLACTISAHPCKAARSPCTHKNTQEAPTRTPKRHPHGRYFENAHFFSIRRKKINRLHCLNQVFIFVGVHSYVTFFEQRPLNRHLELNLRRVLLYNKDDDEYTNH